MQPRLFVGLVLASLLPAVAQEPATSGVPQWQYVKYDDPLHAKTVDRLVLQGAYITPPRFNIHPPALVVECSDGKVKKNYFDVGAIVDRAPRGLDPGVRGSEARIDGKKTGIYYNQVSTDGQAIFFPRVGLEDILKGKDVLIGVNEYLGPQIVMRFIMPSSDAVMEKCGEDRILIPRDRWGRPIKAK